MLAERIVQLGVNATDSWREAHNVLVERENYESIKREKFLFLDYCEKKIKESRKEGTFTAHISFRGFEAECLNNCLSEEPANMNRINKYIDEIVKACEEKNFVVSFCFINGKFPFNGSGIAISWEIVSK